MMTRYLWLFALLAFRVATIGADVTLEPAVPKGPLASPTKHAAPGVEAAQALSTITGVAISPLLGVTAVGAWKYFKTPPERRARLPWYAQPYFWVPALVLVLAVFIKDAAGTAMPVALKKPFDVLELFENKVSALIVAGAFVPLIVAIFGSAPAEDSAFLQGQVLALIDPSPALNMLLIPFAIAIFLIVWLVAHVINVLILISPFGIVDAALKSARLFVLSTLTAASFANPYLGAALSVLIIVICYFLAGRAFRMAVFGTVFAWDLFTMAQRRFKPSPAANWVFTSRKLQTTPARVFGKLSRDAQGQLILNYRPLLVLRSRSLVLPAAKYAVGRGLIYPELLQTEGDYVKSALAFPPRYRGHEDDLAQIYNLPEIQDTGVIKGVKAFWRWLRELLGFKVSLVSAAPSPVQGT